MADLAAEALELSELHRERRLSIYEMLDAERQMFVEVAAERLPRDVFLTMMEEAGKRVEEWKVKAVKIRLKAAEELAREAADAP